MLCVVEEILSYVAFKQLWGDMVPLEYIYT